MPWIESIHPYPAGSDQTWTVTVPGAHHVYIRFDPLSDAGTGYIELLDENNVEPWSNFPGVSIYTAGYGGGGVYSILGDTIKVHLVGGDGTAYGFKAWVDDVTDVSGPYKVDPNYTGGQNTDSEPGPYYASNGNVYMAFWSVYDDTMAISRSTDGGVTWSVIHNVPDAGYGFVHPGQTDQDIRIAFNSLATNNLWVLGNYNIDSETYSQITTYQHSTNNFQGSAYNRALGYDHFFYRLSQQFQLYVQTYNGSSMGSAVHISDNVSSSYITTFSYSRADEDGDLHIPYSATPNSYPASYTLYYRQLKADGSLTSVVTLTTGLNRVSNTGFTGNHIVFAYRDVDPDFATYRFPWIFYGTDYHDDVPIFSQLQVSDLYDCREVTVVDGPSGLVYIWWTAVLRRTGEYIGEAPIVEEIEWVQYRSFDGTDFGPVLLFHSEDDYPSPANNVAGQFLHYLNPPVWSDTYQQWGDALGMEYNPLGTNDQLCAGGFVWFDFPGGPPPPPPPPPGGGLSGANDSMLVADLGGARATLPDYD